MQAVMSGVHVKLACTAHDYTHRWSVLEAPGITYTCIMSVLSWVFGEIIVKDNFLAWPFVCLLPV